MTPNELILGPQVPPTNSYYDQTQISRGKFWGEACPISPPTDASLDAFVMLQYYDLPLCEYIAYERTKDAAFLSYGRKCADSWWQHPWIGEGQTRLWPDSVSPPPRHAGVAGLILRALDGRPEMLDWINAYIRFSLDHWCKKRLNDPSLFYGVREGAFALSYGISLAVAHPDAQVRAAYLADCELIATQYYGRLQHADGSWRWDDSDFTDTDGGTLKGIMQPFMIGLLLRALIDVHRISTNETVKTNIQNQLTKSCRHLYSGGPYSTQRVPSLNVNLRGFHYTIHGGTTVNPTKYEKGNYPADWDTQDPSDVQNARQAIGPIIAAFGYCYQLTKDPFFKTTGDELWDSAYGPTDGIHNYMAGDAKSYNQNCMWASKYLAWIAESVAQPTPIPSPDGAKARTIIDSSGAKWTIGSQSGNGPTLRDDKQMGGGEGSLYKFYSNVVYVLGTDSKWWQWTGAGWVKVGSEPGITTTALPKRVVRTVPSDDAALLALIVEMESLGYELKASPGNRLVFQR